MAVPCQLCNWITAICLSPGCMCKTMWLGEREMMVVWVLGGGVMGLVRGTWVV